MGNEDCFEKVNYIVLKRVNPNSALRPVVVALQELLQRDLDGPLSHWCWDANNVVYLAGTDVVVVTCSGELVTTFKNKNGNQPIVEKTW
jgi:hypothetical protein